MKLISVYRVPDGKQILYELLSEREGYVNISHKQMPTWQEHSRFVGTMPYRDWYLIEQTSEFVGSIYVTREREVGMSLFKKYQNMGFGALALAEVKRRHQGKLYAHISVNNPNAMRFWEQNGFKPLQVTHVYEPNSHA